MIILLMTGLVKVIYLHAFFSFLHINGERVSIFLPT